jgi:hypothetical protein
MPLKERERERERDRERAQRRREGGVTSRPAHSSSPAILMSLTRADGVEVAGTRTAREEE